MIRNVGSPDRVVRILAGIAILTLGILNRSWWGALGIVPIATALTGWCPLYLPFGISTCRAPGAKSRA